MGCRGEPGRDRTRGILQGAVADLMTWLRRHHCAWLSAARFVRGIGLVLLCAGTCLAAPAADEAAVVLERRIKAALLYRFINYVEWPDSAFASPGAAFTISIAGAEGVAA